MQKRAPALWFRGRCGGRGEDGLRGDGGGEDGVHGGGRVEVGCELLREVLFMALHDKSGCL
jgi:hypothetical protein